MGAVTAAVTFVALSAAQPAAAQSSGFFAATAWAPPKLSELVRLYRGGAGTLRQSFEWKAVEARRGHYDWSQLDRIVGDASQANLAILATILGSPPWAAKKSGWPPTSSSARRAYVSFVKRMVARYGPKGGFAQAHPRSAFKPVRHWQVWNEQNLSFTWTNGKPNAREYVYFLKLTRDAIKSQDRDARIILGGLPYSRYGPHADEYLDSLYRVRGFRSLIDAVALHTYGYDDNVIVREIRDAKRVMNRHHDTRRSIWLTELGWATAGPKNSPFVKSQKEQARLLKVTYKRLKAARKSYRIGLVSWFSWRDRQLGKHEAYWWGPYTGLFNVKGNAKPAWAEFAKTTGGDPGRGNLDTPPPTPPTCTLPAPAPCIDLGPPPLDNGPVGLSRVY